MTANEYINTIKMGATKRFTAMRSADKMESCGSIRIKKATTLQRWIDKGWYQREIDNGYTFAPACGRFRIGKCECSRCQKPNGGWEKKEVLKRNGLFNGL